MGDLSTNKPQEQLLRSHMNHISHEEDIVIEIIINFSNIKPNV
jgi:hypothetical protein